MIEGLMAKKPTISITELTEELIDVTGYLAELERERERSIEAASRIENIQEFLSVTKDFDKNNEEPTLEEFLSDVALMSDLDNDGERNENVVSLMSLHSAKGLEFPVIFILGVEEGIFPHSRALFETLEMEEERRLAYVGITRAQEEAYLLSAQSRMLYGRVHMNPISRFIEELPEEYLRDLKAEERKLNRIKKTSPVTTKRSDASKMEWQVGDKAQHKTWGIGTVVSTKNEGDALELQVAFAEPVGVKKLLAKFAPLDKI